MWVGFISKEVVVIIVTVIFCLKAQAGSIYLRFDAPDLEILPLPGARVLLVDNSARIVYASALSDVNGKIEIPSSAIDVYGNNLDNDNFYKVAVESQNDAVTITHDAAQGIAGLAECGVHTALNIPTPIFPTVIIKTGREIVRSTNSIYLNWQMSLVFMASTKMRQMSSEYFSYTPPKVNVYMNMCEGFNENNYRGYFFSIDETNKFFELVSDIAGQKIVLFEEFITYTRAVIYVFGHEYGHWIHYCLDGSDGLPGPGGPHSIDEISSEGTALTEGFAEFTGNLFFNYFFSSFRPGYAEIANYDYLRLDGRIQKQVANSPDLPVKYRTWIEGLVAGFLWDLVDDKNDGGCEVLANNCKLIADGIKGSRPNNITELKNALVPTGPESLDDIYTYTFITQFPSSCEILSFNHYGELMFGQHSYVMYLEVEGFQGGSLEATATLVIPDANGAMHQYIIYDGVWQRWAPGVNGGSIGEFNWPNDAIRIVDGTLGRELEGEVVIAIVADTYLPYVSYIKVVEEPPVSAVHSRP